MGKGTGFGVLKRLTVTVGPDAGLGDIFPKLAELSHLARNRGAPLLSWAEGVVLRTCILDMDMLDDIEW